MHLAAWPLHKCRIGSDVVLQTSGTCSSVTLVNFKAQEIKARWQLKLHCSTLGAVIILYQLD